ncbi:hypothetical protein TI03_07095, partial [Achromatium sp. WMS1]
ILRALEVWHLTGRPLSAQQQRTGAQDLPYQVLVLALIPKDREILKTRIAIRFNTMLEQGLEQEVTELLVKIAPQAPSLRCVGYRQMVQYLLGFTDKSTMQQQGIIATQHLAKRQITWLRTERNIQGLYDEADDIETLAYTQIENWLKMHRLEKKIFYEQ